MTHLRRKLTISLCAILGAVTMLPDFAFAQTGTTVILDGGSEVAQPQQPVIPRGSSVTQPQISAEQGDRPNRVTIVYIPPANPQFQELYDFLKERRALEKVQELLSPIRLPKELTIKMVQCGEVNSFYALENGQPTVTICYEYLQNISAKLPKETTPIGLRPSDAAVGQFVWTTLHEVGHATFDIFNVSIFGSEEDAADNFATYIMLHFGNGQARPLIAGAAWKWSAYVQEYKRNPVVPRRLAAFTSSHGQPEERFYNLLCLAYGADPKIFPEVESFLPPTRLPRCKFEYARLDAAFRKEIVPHIDLEMAKRVLDTNWLSGGQPSPASQK